MTTPALIQTEYATGQEVAPSPDQAGDMVSYRATHVFATGDLTLGQIVEMGPLPANCQLVDVILDTDSLDSGAGSAAIKLNVGIMDGSFGSLLDSSGNARTCDATIIYESTVAQAGGVVRPTLATAFREAWSDADQGIGVEVQTAPDVALSGTLGLTVIYRG